jgi:hypothetical protein
MSNDLLAKNSHNNPSRLLINDFYYMTLLFMEKISSYFSNQYTLFCLLIIVLLQSSVSFSNDKIENFVLTRPKAGIIKVTIYSNNRLKGDLAFDVIEPSTIEVKIYLPLLKTSSLSNVNR